MEFTVNNQIFWHKFACEVSSYLDILQKYLRKLYVGTPSWKSSSSIRDSILEYKHLRQIDMKSSLDIAVFVYRLTFWTSFINPHLLCRCGATVKQYGSISSGNICILVSSGIAKQITCTCVAMWFESTCVEEILKSLISFTKELLIDNMQTWVSHLTEVFIEPSNGMVPVILGM